MSMSPEFDWAEGHGAGYYTRYNVPKERWCNHCDGTGERTSMHRFTGGWYHKPCPTCGGSGRKNAEPSADNV